MNPNIRKTVTTCPVCESSLHVSHLECRACGTVLQGDFTSCPFCGLSQELYDFLTVFIRCEGVIRDIERDIGISYPAVKNRIRRLIAALGMEEYTRPSQDDHTETVLQAVKSGEMSVKKAIYELKTQENR